MDLGDLSVDEDSETTDISSFTMNIKFTNYNNSSVIIPQDVIDSSDDDTTEVDTTSGATTIDTTTSVDTTSGATTTTPTEDENEYDFEFED